MSRITFRSSTILDKGPLFLDNSPGRFVGGADLNSGKAVTWSGVGGVESPSTAVLGRKREAMTTRWFLSELITLDGDERGGSLWTRDEETGEL